jgi:hypothetical protein
VSWLLLWASLASADPAWEPMICAPPGASPEVVALCEAETVVLPAEAPAPAPPPPLDTRWWLASGIAALVAARTLVAARDRVDPRGALGPWLARGRLGLGVAGVAALAVAIGSVLLAAPEPVAAALLALAAVAAARDTLSEVLAGAAVRLEHRVRPGLRVSVGEASGVVEQLGLRAVWVRDGSGSLAAIPYRRVLAEGVAVDPERWPLVELELPAGPPPDDVAAAARLLPWLAPGSPVDVAPADAGLRVRVRLLDAAWADRAAAVLRQRFAA